MAFTPNPWSMLAFFFKSQTAHDNKQSFFVQPLIQCLAHLTLLLVGNMPFRICIVRFVLERNAYNAPDDCIFHLIIIRIIINHRLYATMMLWDSVYIMKMRLAVLNYFPNFWFRRWRINSPIIIIMNKMLKVCVTFTLYLLAALSNSRISCSAFICVTESMAITQPKWRHIEKLFLLFFFILLIRSNEYI